MNECQGAELRFCRTRLPQGARPALLPRHFRYKLRQLLAAFPLPPGSAQLDLIAGNIHQFTSMEFRRVG